MDNDTCKLSRRKERVRWIDVAKAFAIIFVVIGHVVGGYTGNYSISKYDRFVEQILRIIYYFHMPLFFMLSGWTFGISKRIDNANDYCVMIKNKAKRLLVPYFVFSTLQILIKLPFQGKINSVLSWKSIPLIVLQPVDQFWFIYVLFFLCCIFGLLEWKCSYSHIVSIVIVCIAVVGGYY